VALFIHHHRFSAMCGRHVERHRGCCPPCSARGHHQEGRGRRGVGRRYPSPRPGHPPPPRGGGVQGHHLVADGYRYPSACAILAFIGIFPDRGPGARPRCLFNLRRHGRHRTSPSGDRSAQRPPADEHHPRLLLHQLRLLV
jgi:hypothetical protein